MQLLHSLSQAKNLPPTVVALGMFDGLHRGHQAVITTALSVAEQTGLIPSVFSFKTHPREALTGEATPLLSPGPQKAALLESAGVKLAAIVPFDSAIQTLSAQDFVETLLLKQLNAGHVVVGYDFCYGHKRLGTLETLKADSKRLGFGLTIVNALTDPTSPKVGGIISSSSVKTLLLQGLLSQANTLLGRPYTLSGPVLPGDNRGAALGFATANLAFNPQVQAMPKPGVYAGWAYLNNQRYGFMANWGVHPTFETAQTPLLEVHLLDYQGSSFYGEPLTVELHHRLRDEQRFESPEALIAQIKADEAQTRQLLTLQEAAHA